MSKVILFDIDGTLIDSGGASRKSLNKVFQRMFGVKDAFASIIMAGKTDIQIIKEGLSVNGLGAGCGMVSSIVAEYVRNLGIEIDNDERHAKPGVFELLNALEEKGLCLLGLLTGNIEEGARIKLGAFGLNRYFPTGAYGSDHEDRQSLLPIAIERFRKLIGTDIRYTDCTVIGDTPEDIKCAKHFGARAVAVSTGRYSYESLLCEDADLVFRDLSEALPLIHLFSR